MMRWTIKSLLVICSTLCNDWIYSDANPLLGKDVTPALFKDFPFMVSIGHVLVDKTAIHHKCGGSLISKRHILTAAHCMTNHIDGSYYKPGQFIVRVGSAEYKKGIPYKLESFRTFEQYAVLCAAQEKEVVRPAKDNDIAIIKLKEEVNVPGVIPIRMTQRKNSFFIGKTVKTAGWGHALPENHSQDKLLDDVTIPSTYLSKPLHLQTVSLTVVTADQAWQNIWGPTSDEFEDEFSKTRIFTNANPFNLLGNADSGGPLVYENELIAVNEGLEGQSNADDEKVENDKKDGDDDDSVEIYLRNGQNEHVGLEYYKQFINDLLTDDKLWEDEDSKN